MSSSGLIRKETTGSLYVFFQSEEYPTSPSYITYDTDLMAWSNATALVDMVLHDQENGVYQSAPQAVYFNNKIYLFGRASDNTVVSMNGDVDGTNWSEPVPVGGSSPVYAYSGNLMPFVWTDKNNQSLAPVLYLFCGDKNNNISAVECDGSLNVTNQFGSADESTCAPDICMDPADGVDMVVRYNRQGTLYVNQFYPDENFDPNSPSSNISLTLGSSTVNCFDDSSFTFYQGGGANGDGCLYVNNTAGSGTNNKQSDPVALNGIKIYTAPSAVVLSADNTIAYVAVFYVEDNDQHIIKVAGIEITLSNGTPTYKVAIIQDTGVSVASANCSPCALAIS